MTRWVLVVLALVSQLALGSIGETGRATAASNAAFDAAAILCLPGHHASPVASRRPHRSANDTVASHAVSLELSAILVPAAPVVPSMRALAGDPSRRPLHPRAPPAAFTTALRARAPPILA